ncbi:MBL fold metallo-hydrolase [Halovivax sp.]|uniref:MBL fold metallo-hydrolase n=1 Tax=Halovivax sp. TaxID=1935978 RepID=UPI0025B88F77|nr:MBL fold metallo-hydrolase [Halovivax sp.]
MDVVRRALSTETSAPHGTTNAYVVGRDPALLVDPAARTDQLDELVRARGVEHILVTHTHPDHVGAVAAYRDELDATCWALRSHTDRFEAATGFEPDDAFGDGDRLELGTGRVRILALPGHAPDHLGVDVGGGPVCCGDCAVREGSVVVGGPNADMRAYLNALRRLRSLDPPTLLPGHGPPIERPAAVLDRLIEHRERRERRVYEAVASGARAPDEIVDRAYEKDLSGVEDLARATVIAHLRKLAADDRIEWDGERARPR